MKRSLLPLWLVALPACGWVLGDIPANPSEQGDAAPGATTGVGTPSSSSSTTGIGGAVGASGSGTASGGTGVGAGVGGAVGSGGVSGGGATGAGGVVGVGGAAGVGGASTGGAGAGVGGGAGLSGAATGAGGAAGTGGSAGAVGVGGGAGNGGAAGKSGAGGSGGGSGNGGKGGSAGASGSGGSAGSGGASGAGVGTAGSGGAGTSGSGGTGGFVNDAGPDAGDMCDRDGDGYKSLMCANGDDCDDDAPLVHPNQTTYFDVPTHPGGNNYDYNCNNVPEPRFDSVNCGLLGLLCNNAASAFLGMTAPQCGQVGRFGHCMKSTLTCDEQVELDPFKQPCR